MKDAFLLVARRDGRFGDVQTAGCTCPDAIDRTARNQRVGLPRARQPEPRRRLRIVLDETEGIASRSDWEAVPVVQEQPHIMHQNNRVTLDAQRFARRWVPGAGHRLIRQRDDRRRSVETWIGSRDRSWGIGRSARPNRRGGPPTRRSRHVVALHLMAFDDFRIVGHHHPEAPDGFRSPK